MTIGCEVCVIGGGVMGATLAASLCERNVETVLLEAGTVAGQGASAFSGGLVRCYDPDPTIMALSSHALAIQQKRILLRCLAVQSGARACCTVPRPRRPTRLRIDWRAIPALNTLCVSCRQGMWTICR